MQSIFRYSIAAAMSVGLWALVPWSAHAQAFTPPEGVGGVTVAWQVIDNVGHRLSDGFNMPGGQSISASALFEVDYGVTDRLAATAGLPYVFAKYTGAQPPFSRLPVDTCACWHSSFQDLSFAARYRLGNETWAVTPMVRLVLPTHDYAYAGEAVVGRRLREGQIGVSAGLRLIDVLPRAAVQASYTYSFVERALEDVKIDRSSGTLQLGYALTRRLYASGTGVWQRTHGGLRFGSPTGDPFSPPGEFVTFGSPRFAQRDRVLRSNWWQVGGGVAYTTGPVDLFFSFTKYIWGRDAHNGQVYTFGSTWYFDLSR